MRFGKLERLLHDLDALALQHVGKSRVVLDVAMIELRNQLLLAPVPIMEEGRNDPARLDLGIETDPVEQLQRGGMVGARAWHLLKEIVLTERLDQIDLNVLLRQHQCEREPDRSGADDDDALDIAWHAYGYRSASCPGARQGVRLGTGFVLRELSVQAPGRSLGRDPQC